MPCPEQAAWGGVLKRYMLRAYGIKGTPFYSLRHFLLWLFLWRTRRVYRGLARQLVRQYRDYKASGMEVVGVVGIDGSPSCGVHRRLDLAKAFDSAAACPLVELSRSTVNAGFVKQNMVDGQGLFIAAIQEALGREQAQAKFIGHDMFSE
jgi:hypothetical protein